MLASVLLAIAGLSVSLTVRPRRLFVRVHDGEPTGVEVAGLDRVDGRPGLGQSVAALAAACGLTSRPDDGTPPRRGQGGGAAGATLADDPTPPAEPEEPV
ncbi:MAG: cytochrome c biogenesis protein ResB [Propionicimonas sp.]|nr:cytochrome c biogenesis protein ResB [Propionicimonas sp.]